MRHQATGNRKKNKVVAFTLVALFFALCAPADAQSGKMSRVGFISGDPGPYVEAFRQGLRNLGYVEGKNIVIEHRNVEGNTERIPTVVAELIRSKVDVLVASQLTAIRAAKEATQTIPIVVITTVDPVAARLVESLARPGGNITGVTRLTRELNGKRLEVLKEAVPRTSRVGILFADTANARNRFKEYETAAQALNISVQPIEILGPKPDFTRAVQAGVKQGVNSLITQQNSLLNRFTKEIGDVAIKTRLASMCEKDDYVEAGCLMSYSANDADQYKRAAVYVDKILKGAKPADLPIEQPAKFELVMNLKTAKTIGLTIPPNVLARADRVIR
jgi:putative ABC transport system substrate-binding protein